MVTIYFGDIRMNIFSFLILEISSLKSSLIFNIFLTYLCLIADNIANTIKSYYII